jgi:membrane-bound serine protease (ClpP class)
MAPATNLGAATPVAIGGTSPPSLPGDSNPLEPSDESGREPGEETAEPPAEDEGATEPAAAPSGQSYPVPATASERKAINDAVAYIRSLAELRGRNAEWAEAAVRGSESLSAEAALQRGVIDLIARDRSDLLRQLDGRIIDGTVLSLPTSTLITVIEPDWRTRFLAVISNPTVAYMLMLVGIYGLIFEGYNPGAMVPGVVGAICLLLAAFAFQILPVNYAGLGLMLLGLILIVAEFFVPSFGALGIGGVAAFVFGSLILIDTDIPGFEVASSVIASIAFTGALLVAATIWLAVRARNRHVVSGVEEMAGLPAEALEDFETQGQVWVHGERWLAHSSTPVTKGQVLTVKQVDGLVLQVEPAGSNS